LVVVFHTPYTGCCILIHPGLKLSVSLLLLQELAALIKELLLESPHSLLQIENFCSVNVAWRRCLRSFCNDGGACALLHFLNLLGIDYEGCLFWLGSVR
jgi:hypothetical protein